MGKKKKNLLPSLSYNTYVHVIIQVAKALILKANHLGYELTNQVIAWCSNPALGKQASGGFDILIGDDSLALNKASFATMTVSGKEEGIRTDINWCGLERFYTSNGSSQNVFQS